MSATRVTILGAGHWGPNLIRNFQTHARSEVRRVVDLDPERLRPLEGRYPGVELSTDLDAALSDPDVDAIAICTPTVTHHALTKRALEAGKHVFVEKPLAETAADCQELIDLARAQGRTLFVGHVFVYNAGIEAVREIIQGGELGRISYIQCTRTNLGPIRTGVNVLWDLAPHDLSILRYWLGQEPESVTATGGRYLSEAREDVVFATYTFPGGVLANLHVSWLNPKKVREIVVVGDQRMLVWNDLNIDAPVLVYDKRVDREPSGVVDTFLEFRTQIHQGLTVTPRIAANEPLKSEVDAFLRSLEDPSASRSTGEDGLAVVRALACAQQSVEQRGLEVEIA